MKIFTDSAYIERVLIDNLWSWIVVSFIGDSTENGNLVYPIEFANSKEELLCRTEEDYDLKDCVCFPYSLLNIFEEDILNLGASLRPVKVLSSEGEKWFWQVVSFEFGTCKNNSYIEVVEFSSTKEGLIVEDAN